MAGRVVIVHSLEDARAAVAAAGELGVPVTLASAPGAAGYLGALWFRELLTMIEDEHPDVAIDALFDCADKPGFVLAALRQGLRRLRFTGPKATAATLAAMADDYGAEIVTGRLTALDLLDRPDAQDACRRWLSRR